MCSKNYFKCIVLFFGLCLLLRLNGCVYHQVVGEYEIDVTKTDKYWEGYKRGRVYELLMDVFLRTTTDRSTKFVLVAGTDYRRTGYYGAPSSIQEYKKRPERYPDVLGLIPSGTRICCTKITKHGAFGWGSSLSYFAEILDGPHKGILVEISDISIPIDELGQSSVRFKPDLNLLKSIDVTYDDILGVAGPYSRMYFTKALREKNIEAAEVYLHQCIEVNLVEELTGYTPLHYAVQSGIVDLVKYVLGHDIDINAIDVYGETSLHYICSEFYLDYYPEGLVAEEDLKIRTKITSLLIAHGADVNVKDKKGERPLKKAIRMRFNTVADLLRQHGAKK